MSNNDGVDPAANAALMQQVEEMGGMDAILRPRGNDDSFAPTTDPLVPPAPAAADPPAAELNPVAQVAREIAEVTGAVGVVLALVMPSGALELAAIAQPGPASDAVQRFARAIDQAARTKGSAPPAPGKIRCSACLGIGRLNGGVICLSCSGAGEIARTP